MSFVSASLQPCLFPGSWLRSECNLTHRTSNTALHLQFKTWIDTSIDYMGEYEQTEEEYRFEGGKIPNYVLNMSTTSGKYKSFITLETRSFM